MPLKMIVRTMDHCFPIVQGQFLAEERKKHTPPALHQRRFVPVQVSNSPGMFNGCCCHPFFHRLVILREMSFVTYHRCQWDLYVISCQYEDATSVQDGYTCLHMALIPQQDCNTIAECRGWKTWVFLGPCQACMLGMELEVLIGKHFGRWGNKASRSFHWHLDVFMDYLEDESYCCVSKAIVNNSGVHPKDFDLLSSSQIKDNANVEDVTRDDEDMKLNRTSSYTGVTKTAMSASVLSNKTNAPVRCTQANMDEEKTISNLAIQSHPFR